LFLRTNKKTPDEMKIRMHTSGGDVQFGIPVMKVKNYSVNSIFEKKLYFLIPFYIFTHEDDFKSCESDNSKLEKLKQEYVEIFEKLEEAAAEGELSYYYMRSIIEMTKLVLENIARKYENVKEGVNSVMGGRVLEHESKTIYNEGWNEGRRDGKLEEKQATAKRLFEMGTKVADISRIVDASINLVRQWISTPANTTTQTI